MIAFKRTSAMALAGGILLLFAANTSAQRQMEYLQRGVIAIHQGEGRVFVSWRMLGTEPDEIGFNLYRSSNGEEPLKLNDQPLTQATNFVDRRANLNRPNAYFVRPVLKGQEQMSSDPFVLPAHAQPYISIPLQTLEGYRPNDASVGDLDGDGVYEIVLHQAPRGRDNSRPGLTDAPVLEAYEVDGTLLWRCVWGRCD